MKLAGKTVWMVALGFVVMTATACDEPEEADAKSDDGGKAERTAKDDGSKKEGKKEGGSIKTGPLSQETCDKACRKWNFECAPQGAPPSKDPEGAVKMCADTCVMTTSNPSMKEVAIVSWAQAHCLDQSDCKAYKDCVGDAEDTLEGKK